MDPLCPQHKKLKLILGKDMDRSSLLHEQIEFTILRYSNINAWSRQNVSVPFFFC